MTYNKWDIVVAAFPFSDGTEMKRRPALVCAERIDVKRGITVYWLLMITAAELSTWRGDVRILESSVTGLVGKPSIIRTAKIACVEDNLIVKKVGRLDDTTQKAVSKILKSRFG